MHAAPAKGNGLCEQIRQGQAVQEVHRHNGEDGKAPGKTDDIRFFSHVVHRNEWLVIRFASRQVIREDGGRKNLHNLT